MGEEAIVEEPPKTEEEMLAEWEAMEGADTAAENTDAADDGENERVLSQNEIDSLLGFSDEGGGTKTLSGLKAILNSSMISYERLPMLEVAFDRLVRMLSTSLRNFTAENVDVTLESIKSIRFGDYLNSIPLPAMISVFRAEEWDNSGLVTIDSALIYSIVDVLLGGRKGSTPLRVEGRPYTTIERKLMERLVTIFLQDLQASFEPLCKVNFQFDRLETNPSFATIVRPGNAAIITRLRVEMDNRGGMIELLLPYATLEPVRELLLQMFMGEKFGRDAIWETHLANELWNTNVEVQALLDQTTATLKDVLAWKVGTRVMLNATPSSAVSISCGEHVLFSGKMGQKNDHIAVQIDHIKYVTKKDD